MIGSRIEAPAHGWLRPFGSCRSSFRQGWYQPRSDTLTQPPAEGKKRDPSLPQCHCLPYSAHSYLDCQRLVCTILNFSSSSSYYLHTPFPRNDCHPARIMPSWSRSKVVFPIIDPQQMVVLARSLSSSSMFRYRRWQSRPSIGYYFVLTILRRCGGYKPPIAAAAMGE